MDNYFRRQELISYFKLIFIAILFWKCDQDIKNDFFIISTIFQYLNVNWIIFRFTVTAPRKKKSIFVWLMGKCIVFRIKGGNLKQIYIESSGNARIPKRIKTKRLPSYTYNTYTAIGQIKTIFNLCQNQKKKFSVNFVHFCNF